ncbi:MAG: DNA internalization-related competence protein ComEC/Rec2 [Oscillospiraceae bacterium]|nr:DNA internalization-related competence protein ComEC/Rec2 [Oscillospiraceae bacterium]
MRELATVAFSFAAGSLTAALLPGDSWYPWAALGAAAGFAAVYFLRKRIACAKRALLILGALSVAFLYVWGYETAVCRPVKALCGQTREFSGIVMDEPVETEQGAKVTICLHPAARAVVYGEAELLTLKPGQRLSGTARWQDASRIREDDITTFTSRGVYALLYVAGPVMAETAMEHSIWFTPQRLCRAVKEMAGRVWDDPATAGFVTAELTGDRSSISQGDAAVIDQAGLAHLFAVSGLHCAFLVTLLGFFLPKRRPGLVFGICTGALFLYALMVGMTASVVRACLMQVFLLAEPLLRRERDSITVLGAALLLILLVNPYAAAGAGLQLSFGATLGMVLWSEKLCKWMRGCYRGNRKWLRREVAFLSANLAATLTALVFTVPLTAVYFGIFTLLSPLSNLLALPAASWNFMVSFLTVALGFVFLPAARIAGVLSYCMVHYVVWLARMVNALPWHALYLNNRYLIYWLVYVYVLLGACLIGKARPRARILAGSLAVLTLLLAVKLHSGVYRSGTMSAVAVDVGQGECILLHSGNDAVLVDCGSSNTYISGGERAADTISGIGIGKLSALVLTHYHADHTNGVAKLMARVRVEELWLPDIDDAFGVKERLESLAAQNGTAVRYIRRMERMAAGAARLTVYPPVGTGDMNEQGLTVLCSAGDFDLLVTGDMAGSTEKALIKQYDLPDVEVLVVSHHGSKYSSDSAFLEAIRPEAAIICVGENSYGHPTQEAMLRLAAVGAAIYRTDQQGDILVTVGEGGK